MPDKEKSPWMGKPRKGKPQEEAEPVIPPEEEYEQIMKADDAKLARALASARLLATAKQEPANWRICWACGVKTPLVFRDPEYGILVCRKCMALSDDESYGSDVSDLISTVSDLLGMLLPAEEDDDGLEEDPEADEDELETDEDATPTTIVTPTEPNEEASDAEEEAAEPDGNTK